MKKIIFWLPRVLAILIVLFLTMFSFDVFGGQSSLWSMIAGFFIHSIPSITLLLLLIISWHRPKLGGIMFLTFAGIFMIVYLITMWERFGLRVFPLLLILDGPIILTGILFFQDNKINNSN